MRTRSSAKSIAEQGPESTQGLKTAESSQKAPPKAAKPRGRVQGKPKSPPARKDAAKAKARNKSSNVEDVGTETGEHQHNEYDRLVWLYRPENAVHTHTM